MREVESGREVEIEGGMVATAEPGSITQTRPMTDHETGYSDFYDSPVMNYMALEQPYRRATVDRGTRESRIGEIFRFSSRKRTALDFRLTVKPVRSLQGIPKAMLLKIRTNSPTEVSASGYIRIKRDYYNVHYRNIKIPAGTETNEWSYLATPLWKVRFAPPHHDYINFDLKPPNSSVKSDDEEYIVEVAPLLLGFEPEN